MYNANIEKTKNTSITTIKLNSQDRQKLRKKTIGYGKLASTAAEIGVNRNTLYNALGGKKLMPDIASKIRSFLYPAEQSL